MPAQPNQSLINGLACLQALASEDRPMGSREMGRLLGIEHTKANRMLGTLAGLGLAEQTDERKYLPGPAIHILAAQALKGSGLLAAALPFLRKLEDELLQISLGVLWKGRVCYLVSASAGQPVEAGIGQAQLFPAAVSTVGLPLLAHGNKDLLKPAYAAAEEDGEIIDQQKLEQTLNEIRESGFAIRINGSHADSIGIAVGSPPLAGLALTGKIDKNSLPRLQKRLEDTALKIANKVKEK